MQKSNNLAVLILAAGKSSRLGVITKQLLKYKDESFLKIAVKKALEISSNVYVVLGHNSEKCQKELAQFDINILYNKDYEKGLGSSLSFGISSTSKFENTLVLLCDQPFIPLSHLEKLKNSIDNKTIISSFYKHTNKSTVPAIFPKKYYAEVEKLNEDFGAKHLLQNSQTINIELEKEFAVDIDTKEDIEKYLK